MHPREFLARLLRSSVHAVDPHAIIPERLSVVTGGIRLPCGEIVPYSRRVLVLGLGKASPAMDAAVESLLGDRIDDGLIVTPYPSDLALHHVRVLRGDHPYPGPNSAIAGAELLRLAATADADTLAIVLVSGGGSACAIAPIDGLTWEDKRLTTDLLLRSGADIREINTVRRHLSAIKNSGLRRALGKAQTISLILSDVVDGPLSAVASGPTLSDDTSPDDALAVLERRCLLSRVPRPVIDCLRNTRFNPPRNDSRHHILTIGDHRTAREAAIIEAQRMGLRVLRLEQPLSGEAREQGRVLAGIAAKMSEDVLVASGETVVTVTGDGKGGRNQELALGFLQAEVKAFTLLAASTDGVDGPTDAAGGFADDDLRETARRMGLNAGEFLAANNSYEFLKQTDGLFVSGPTGTNVCDLALVVRDAILK
jgi:glycerate 2-kinase